MRSKPVSRTSVSMPPKAQPQDMVVSLDQVIELVRMLLEFMRTIMIMMFETRRIDRDRRGRGGDDDDHGGGGGKRARKSGSSGNGGGP